MGCILLYMSFSNHLLLPLRRAIMLCPLWMFTWLQHSYNFICIKSSRQLAIGFLGSHVLEILGICRPNQLYFPSGSVRITSSSSASGNALIIQTVCANFSYSQLVCRWHFYQMVVDLEMLTERCRITSVLTGICILFQGLSIGELSK